MRLIVLVSVLAACAQQSATTRMTRGFDAQVASGVERARAVTARFTSLDSAAAAGYARDLPKCIADEHHGAMGYHHLNRGYVDAKPDVERPEFLLYERLPDGQYRLNGVEYIVPYRFWPRDSVPPTLLGQPLKREDNYKYWYLHMWIWTENPAGLFADYNPLVRCPTG